ncbi:MAG: hypothetical protein V3V06_00660 [Dehalococcoidia bacterium]
MASIRKRKQFSATVLSVQGSAMGSCHVIADIQVTVVEGQREVSWRGRITSLTEPQYALHGPYLLQPHGSEQPVRIEIVDGATTRLGITSDEYEFLGSGAPPEV